MQKITKIIVGNWLLDISAAFDTSINQSIYLSRNKDTRPDTNGGYNLHYCP